MDFTPEQVRKVHIEETFLIHPNEHIRGIDLLPERRRSKIQTKSGRSSDLFPCFVTPSQIKISSDKYYKPYSLLTERPRENTAAATVTDLHGIPF